MPHKHLRFGAGFHVVLGDQNSQAAQMTLAPGETEGGPDNRHGGADQWLFVVGGEGVAVVEDERIETPGRARSSSSRGVRPMRSATRVESHCGHSTSTSHPPIPRRAKSFPLRSRDAGSAPANATRTPAPPHAGRMKNPRALPDHGGWLARSVTHRWRPAPAPEPAPTPWSSRWSQGTTAEIPRPRHARARRAASP